MDLQGPKRVTERIIQTDIDQTAAIVYQSAVESLKNGNDIYQASLIHEEQPHINLGKTQRQIPEVADDLQFRRWGGGGYIVHDNTYCFIDARQKLGPKEGTKLQRERMAHKTLNALSEVYDQVGVADGQNFVLDTERNEISDTGTVYYKPGDGDIYIQQHRMPRDNDPQLAGIGLAEIEVEDEWVQIGRVCMYPGPVSENAEKLDRNARSNLEEYDRELNERIHAIEDLDSVIEALENNKEECVTAEDYLTIEAYQRGKVLQEDNGYRQADPCF